MEMSQRYNSGAQQQQSSDGVGGAEQDREDLYLVQDPTKNKRGIFYSNNNKAPVLCIMFIFFILLLAFVMSAVALSQSSKSSSTQEQTTDTISNQTKELGIQGELDGFKRGVISKIAFGSCSSYDMRELPIFTEGVIKADPQAWIWLGDMVYLDKPNYLCPDNETINQSLAEGGDEYEQCICDPTWLHVPPACLAGDTLHARNKFNTFLNLKSYRQFVDFMCPNYYNVHQEGTFPPIGIDCERPIFGTYDDHDFGWNDGDGRFVQKSEIKQYFLDAIGEPQNSVRRSALDGIQTQYILNQEYPGKQIQLVLLDERYHRSAFSCSNKKAKECEPEKWNNEAQCKNLFGPKGECCTQDDDIANGFCNDTKNFEDNPEFCDPSRADYANKGFNGSFDSPICDVLGIRQRQWLNKILGDSSAALHLIGSGSVVFGAGECGGDNWECYKQAQKNLIYTLANVTQGCVVILTGDYHHADIKMVQGGEQKYTNIYNTKNLKKPIYQLMSSGMSNSTAKGLDCKDWRVDNIGLRVYGNCSLYSNENFGMVEVDWDKQTVELSIRNMQGNIAKDKNEYSQTISIDLKSCKRIN